MAPRKKVRVSKNRKKNWGKHCDIADVEKFLEGKRFEERIGGAVSEKKNEELFFIDETSGTEKTAIAKKKTKDLRCFQNIGAFSKVPPPVMLHNEPFCKRIKSSLTKKEEGRKKRMLRRPAKKEKTTESVILKGDMFAEELKDLWATEKEIDPEIRDLVHFRDEYTCKKPPKVPEHRFQKPSLLPSVEVPHSGASYNPLYEEHQDLLRKALTIEEQKLKNELHIKRVLSDMFPTKAKAPTQQSKLMEMSQGLFDDEDKEGEDETDEWLTYRNPPVSFDDRLTRSRKRKRKELKQEARLRLAKKLHAKRQNEIARLPSIQSELAKETKTTQERMVKKQENRVARMYKPKVLSTHKYEAPDLEIKLSEELPSCLRHLEPEGSLLEDRYKSLQRRNIIEPRVRRRRTRKYRLKKQVKRHHRNFK